MGRKPNLLIQEFFERGAKLDDQSNRYEHTCKKCGMFFPKGRPDGMNRHLFEKCPNITDYDKARAFAFAQGQMDTKKIAQRLGHDAPQAPPNSMQTIGPSYHQSATAAQTLTMSASTAALNRETSALDTLAEVSRQHLDLSRQRNQGDAVVSIQDQQNQHESQHDMDQWMIQLQQQLNEANRGDEGVTQQYDSSVREEHGHGASSQLMQTASAASELNASLNEPATPGAHNEVVTNDDRSPRAGYRADRLHSQAEQPDSTNLDPALQPQQPVTAPVVPPMTASERESNYSFQFPVEDSPQMHNMQGFGLLSRPSKRQKRNKFSSERRKEVGGIRKLGACLRCRMLKKPCSGETPCLTCRAVGNPRLWRTTCVRTRIADEFSLYNTPYFFARGNAALGRLARGNNPHAAPGRMEVSIGLTKNPIAFSVLRVDNAVTRLDSSLENQSFTIKLDTEEAVSKVDSFLANNIYNTENTHPLLLSTLSRLRSLPADILIAKVLQLHAATTFLCAPEDFDWRVAYITPNEDGSTETPHLLSSSRSDFAVIRAQTLDAFERFAGQTFKNVANELERRLLARATSTPLVTYLVTVLLLNCVERMSLLFRRFDGRTHTHRDELSDGDHHLQHEDMAAAGDDWPLSKAPRHYVIQAASFSALCGMLLRMRQFVPRTVARGGDDSLCVVKVLGRTVVEVHPPDTANGIGDDNITSPHDAERDKDRDKDLFLAEVAGWLEAARVQGGEVWEKSNLSDDDVGEGWRAWDLRFVAGLILPEGYGETNEMNGQRGANQGGEVQSASQPMDFWGGQGGEVDPALGRRHEDGVVH